ncbi:phosphotransferase family protein [Aestuariimicrobium ganziense]|uniref:phosphotransferase family protein n=1 Tax=Aestuariimicrobium ganziense TaxID=2773677 RepID=UPI0019443FEF|nr:aminoglycoside phosphotransferase family protein [Aestuariimicrobium ganziense]
MATPAVAAEVTRILRRHGLGTSHPIESLDGFANVVAVCGSVVVRLNTGRLAGAFAHEAEVLTHLPDDVPHARVIAVGQRASGGEYLVLERLDGQPLQTVWSTLGRAERDRVGRELGTTISHLHALERQPWMHNSWPTAAVAEGRWADAYHAPEQYAPTLLASARGRVVDTDGLLDGVACFLADHPLEPAGSEVFVHTDLHLRNVLHGRDGRLHLVDFEGARWGHQTMEWDMLQRSLREFDHRGLVPGLLATWPALAAVRSSINRVVTAEAMWHLIQLHHWQPGQTWTQSPVRGLQRVLDGSFVAEVMDLVDTPAR